PLTLAVMPHAKNGRLQPDRKTIDIEIARLRDLDVAALRARWHTVFGPTMRIYGEESFGPVVTVVRVSGIDEAVRVANNTEYGLSSAVFGRDIARALGVAKRIEAGICHVNAPTVHDEPQMPFGGTKASGYGRFGGRAAIDEFTELRWITVQTGPRHYPF